MVSKPVSTLLVFSALVLGACSTAGPVLSLDAAGVSPDPELPETLSVTPRSFGFARDAALPPPSGFAGPTPQGAAVASPFAAGTVAARSPELDALIARYADHYEVPLQLVRRVVNRESTFNPRARNGPYWGLMQIHPQTARTMGYGGPPEGLLDAETNLKYAVRYLRGAYITADGDHDQAVRFYSRGYYYDAKRKGLLQETGLRN